VTPSHYERSFRHPEARKLSNTSIRDCSNFFIVQLSHPWVAIGHTIVRPYVLYENSVALLWSTSSTSSSSLLCASKYVPVAGSSSYCFAAGLWQRRHDRPPCLSDATATVGSRCGCTVVFGLRRPDHIWVALIILHWLRIPERIKFKVAILTYNILNGRAPSYLGPLTFPADLSSRRDEVGISGYCKAKIMRFMFLHVIEDYIADIFGTRNRKRDRKYCTFVTRCHRKLLLIIIK